MVTAARLGRWALIAAPFVLLALGFGALVSSPWPAIWRLMLQGRHVVVAHTWRTVGLGGLALACFAAALVVSFNIRSGPR